MKTVRCVLADDEELAREVMQTYIGRLPSLNLISSCSNGMEVYHAIKNNTVDLLFLDIQMPQLTGIELLHTLKTPPPVIITTAYREYAVEGYDLNVIDYLLKPISFERFLKAVEKFEAKNNAAVNIAASEPQNMRDAFMYVKANKKNIRIMLKDVLYIEGLKDYVKIVTTEGELITYQTLTSLEEELSENYFARIHRSYIVSLMHITAFTAADVEIGKKQLPIGASYAKELSKKLMPG